MAKEPDTAEDELYRRICIAGKENDLRAMEADFLDSQTFIDVERK